MCIRDRFVTAHGQPLDPTSAFIDKNIITWCCCNDIYGERPVQGVSQQLPRKKSTQFIDEKNYEKNEHSIPEVIHCSFVGDSVLSIVSSFKTLKKANSQVIIFKKIEINIAF